MKVNFSNLFKKKFKIWTYGCVRRDIETESLSNYFKANGYVETKHYCLASWVIVNTCAYSQEAENLSLKSLKFVHSKKNFFSKVLLTGCLSKINTESIEAFKNTVVLGPKELGRIDEYVKGKVKWSELKEAYQQYSYKKENEHLAFLKIATGCLGACSYCVIKKSTGELKSKALSDIVEEYKDIYQKGKKTFVLVAEDVGSYGVDIKTNIIELLQKLLETESDTSFELFEFNPQWLIKNSKAWRALLDKYGERINKMVIPLQSGSDKVLSKMKRPYNIKDALAEIIYIKTKFPNIKIETHFLVGFPGETEEEFSKTLSLVEEMDFDKLYVYNYSERAGTEAVSFENKISKSLREQRVKKIESIGKNIFIGE